MLVLSTMSIVSSTVVLALENDYIYRIFGSSGLWCSWFAFVAGILGILAYRIPTNTFIAWHYILVKHNEAYFDAN